MSGPWLPIAVIALLAAARAPVLADDPEEERPPEAAEPADEETPPEAPGEGEEKPDDEESAEPGTVDLVIRGEEADRWRLDVGGGWNERDGLYGRVALSTSDFLSRGEAFGAAVEIGDEHELYELEWRTPFLLGRRQLLGVRLFEDATDHPVTGGADFGRRRAGVDLAWGRRFGAHRSFEVVYRYADVAETENLFSPAGDDVSRRADYDVSSLEPRWVYDSLDDRHNPLRGLRLSAAVELSGGVLGGDAELVEPTVGLTWFRPLGGAPQRATASVRTRLGWLDATGDVFSQQRFFTGGQDSVRGFRHRSIGAVAADGTPAVDALGFPLGGDRLAELSVELHLLIGERLRLVLFGDAGGVAARGQSLGSDRLRASAGAELRVSLKRFPLPLRLIWAENLDPLPGDRFDRFSASVGIRF